MHIVNPPAQYLAAATGEQVGGNTLMNVARNTRIESGQGAEEQQVAFKKIKLKFELNALFALK